MKIKSATSYESKRKVISMIYILIWFIGLVVFSETIEETFPFHPIWIAALTFIILVVFLFRASKKYNEPFKCPDCGKIIESSLENSNQDQEAIIYHCNKCEILWHVGNTVK